MKRASVLLLTGAILLTGAASVFGATIVVPTDQPTIQQAIDAAGPGDIIKVNPGTYAEQIVIDEKENLQLIGIVNAAGDRPVIDGTGMLAGDMVRITDSEAILFTKFTVQKAPATDDNVALVSINGVQLVNNRIIDGGDDGIDYESGKGLKIRGCTISNNAGHGIWFNDVEYGFKSYNVISGNTIEANGGDGIAHYYGNMDRISNNTVKGNAGYGIWNEYGVGVKTVGNEVSLNGSYGIYEDSYAGYQNKVVRNKVFDNLDDGIYVYQAVVVQGNTVTGNDGYGIYGYDSGNKILSNTVTGNVDEGIYLYDSNQWIEGNTVNGNDYGVYAYYGDATVLNNTLRNNTYEGVYFDDDTGTISRNLASGNDGTGLQPYYDSVLTTNNVSTKNGALGIDVDDYANAVLNNIVTVNQDDGIGEWVAYSVVKGNTVRNNLYDGISDLENSIVIGNTVTGNKEDGIDASYSNGNVIKRNTATGNGDYDLFDSIPPDDYWIANVFGTKNW